MKKELTHKFCFLMSFDDGWEDRDPFWVKMEFAEKYLGGQNKRSEEGEIYNLINLGNDIIKICEQDVIKALEFLLDDFCQVKKKALHGFDEAQIEVMEWWLDELYNGQVNNSDLLIGEVLEKALNMQRLVTQKLRNIIPKDWENGHKVQIASGFLVQFFADVIRREKLSD